SRRNRTSRSFFVVCLVGSTEAARVHTWGMVRMGLVQGVRGIGGWVERWIRGLMDHWIPGLVDWWGHRLEPPHVRRKHWVSQADQLEVWKRRCFQRELESPHVVSYN